jgi:multiple sugar transport system substrate-binding protein
VMSKRLMRVCLLTTVLVMIVAGLTSAATVITYIRHGSAQDLAIEEQAAKLFMEKNPDIIVKPQVLPWDDYNTKVPIMVAGGTAPDVISAHPALLMQIWDAQALIPLDSYMDADGDLDWDDVLFQGDAIYDGRRVGLPMKSCAHAMRFNEDFFREAGLETPAEMYWRGKETEWNWENFLKMGLKLTRDIDGDGNIDQYFYSGFNDNCNLLSTIRSFGGDVFDPETNKSLFDSPEVREALQMMADMALKHKIQPPPELTRQATVMGITFKTGVIAVENFTTCDLQDLDRDLPFDYWDLIPLPAGPKGFRVWGDTDQMVISSSCKNPEAAYRWIKYRSSKEVWDELYARGVRMAITTNPPRLSIIQSSAFAEAIQPLDPSMMVDLLSEYVIPDPYVPRSPHSDRILFTVVPTEIDNILRGKSIEQAITDTHNLINDILSGK